MSDIKSLKYVLSAMADKGSSGFSSGYFFKPSISTPRREPAPIFG